MGLDMYLKAQKYVGGWNHSKEDERHQFKSILEAANIDPKIVDEGSPGLDVSVNIGYWRKANQIHSWFVKNAQEGKDECQLTYVDREALGRLLNICKRVETNPSLAAELLPPQSGCFFGSTEIDEYYMDDIRRTIQILTKALEDKQLEAMDFYYQSSW